MPKGFLTAYRDEAVELLTRTLTRVVTPGNPYGEQATAFTPAQVVTGNVQPLGDDLRAVYGLSGSVEALRVQLPVFLIAPLDRVGCRGRQWQVMRAERWQDYTLLTVREVPADA